MDGEMISKVLKNTEVISKVLLSVLNRLDEKAEEKMECSTCSNTNATVLDMNVKLSALSAKLESRITPLKNRTNRARGITCSPAKNSLWSDDALQMLLNLVKKHKKRFHQIKWSHMVAEIDDSKSLTAMFPPSVSATQLKDKHKNYLKSIQKLEAEKVSAKALHFYDEDISDSNTAREANDASEQSVDDEVSIVDQLVAVSESMDNPDQRCQSGTVSSRSKYIDQRGDFTGKRSADDANLTQKSPSIRAKTQD